jgi:hypothetical protein
MVKQSQTHGRIVEFEDGAIATLKIPIKMRLKTESERLPVRILSGDHGQYKLMSQHRRLVGRWPADELNEVDDSLVEHLGASIPMEPAFKAGKEVTVQLAKAVAEENHCRSITAAQKAGRATATGSVSAVSNVPASSPPIRQQEQTPIQRPAVQRASPAPTRRALQRQPQSSPIRRQRASPNHLPEPPKKTRKGQAAPLPDHLPEPPKKTQKRRAVEDVVEVDLGPRKLRSRK